jgi:hypothetical protein
VGWLAQWWRPFESWGVVADLVWLAIRGVQAEVITADDRYIRSGKADEGVRAMSKLLP